MKRGHDPRVILGKLIESLMLVVNTCQAGFAPRRPARPLAFHITGAMSASHCLLAGDSRRTISAADGGPHRVAERERRRRVRADDEDQAHQGIVATVGGGALAAGAGGAGAIHGARAQCRRSLDAARGRPRRQGRWGGAFLVRVRDRVPLRSFMGIPR